MEDTGDGAIELQWHNDPEALRWLAIIVGNARPPEAVSLLLSLLDHPYASIGSTVVRALGQIGDARAVDALIERLRDDDAEVRRTATNALGQIDDARAVDALIEQLRDDDAEVRRAALAASANKLVNQTDSELLSHYIDGVAPWLDPQTPISESRIAAAARKLELSPDEIRRRYEALADAYGLHLSWRLSPDTETDA